MALTELEIHPAALNGISTCYRETGVAACGAGHFEQGLWERDAIIGTLWATSQGGVENLVQTRKVLDFFLDQAPLVPYRQLPYNHLSYFLNRTHFPGFQGIDRKAPLLKRLANLEQYRDGGSPLMADTFLILMLAGNYLSSAHIGQDEKEGFWHDHNKHITDFFRDYWKQFVFFKDLIDESPLTSRADCVLKSGNVLLTNILWYKTVVDLSKGIEQFHPKWAKGLKLTAGKIKQAINRQFWPEDPQRRHYIDWVDRKKQPHNYCETLSNCWAIVSGVADREKADKILDFMEEKMIFGDDEQMKLVGTVHPAYEDKVLDRALVIGGFRQWYNAGKMGVFWPEMGTMFAAALKTAGRDEAAEKAIGWVEKLLDRHDTLHEIYDQAGEPIEAKLIWPVSSYKSPKSFAMALGTYLWVKANWNNLQPENLLY